MNKASVPRLFSQLQPQVAQQQEKKRTSVSQDKVKPVGGMCLSDVPKCPTGRYVFQVQKTKLCSLSDR